LWHFPPESRGRFLVIGEADGAIMRKGVTSS
jgi:hypothetical protein